MARSICDAETATALPREEERAAPTTQLLETQTIAVRENATG